MFGVEEAPSQQLIKHVNIVMNGNPDKCFQLEYKHQLQLPDIQKAAENRWSSKYGKNIRLFTPQGVEYESGDLKYVRPNENIYVSKGEDFDANSSFGEYETVRVLGEGGFGRVSLAKHKATSELVAIKVMKAERIGSAHQIDVVFREVENLKALNHPHIVRIHKCYTLKQMKVVLVMEYLEGGELLEYVTQRTRLALHEALFLLRQIASAIEYCHSKNIVHRDLKPQNILFKSKQSRDVKVADFGIAGVAQQFNPDSDIGTLKYMSPEVLSGQEKGNSPAVDVWALGCIFYYLLSGKLPFVGKTSAETMRLIVDGNYRMPKEIPVEESVLRLLARMLDTNPKTRIKAAALCDELAMLAQQPIKTQHELRDITVQVSKKDIPIEVIRQRKDIVRRNRPPGLPVIPKRLEKEKDVIENELRQYRLKRNERSLIKSYETKSSIAKKKSSAIIRQRSLLDGHVRSRESLSELRKIK